MFRNLTDFNYSLLIRPYDHPIYDVEINSCGGLLKLLTTDDFENLISVSVIFIHEKIC